ncbi:uncharacterized protein LOC141719914 [Apium graveolens]|uniref:uncharacterized protein LOC141719914 n=1 Tax=Apium graveolens TaxID=4045 RepID=UPI003D7AE05B
MGKHVFLRIVDAVSNFDPYFQQRIDAVGRKGLSPLQKCTTAMRMLAYGVSADVVDDYVRIGESTAVECLKKFISAIWYAFFGVAGSNNDINVLDRSPVLQGRAPEVNYTVNGNNYNMGYYLTDGIYPEWATFVKTIPRPHSEKKNYLQNIKKANEKTLNERLVCYGPVSQSYMVRHAFGIEHILGES